MYLLFYFIIYSFLVFFLRSFILWKKTNINPLTFNKTDDAHGYNGKVFTFISLLEFVVILFYALAPEKSNYLLPFWYLELPILTQIGWALLVISLILVWLAQSNMKDSWRIGIDDINKTKLITQGFYSYSRNPIFLGIMIANIGLFLVLPNAFTLLIVSLSTISINTQIRLEEEFLDKEFGEEYVNYKSSVGRWFGKIR